MKKLLGALALSGFAAMSVAPAAQAADVAVYGLIDSGLSYVHGENDSTFDMRSGMVAPSRFGIKASETISPDLRVGVVLENGFASDDGSISQKNRLFGREATVSVEGDFGRLVFGRSGVLVSGFGTTGILNAQASPFVGGWGAVRGHRAVMTGFFRSVDNVVTYASPEAAGARLWLQYSGDTGTGPAGKENSHRVDRFYAGAVTWKGEGFDTIAVVERLDHADSKSLPDVSSQTSATLAGNVKAGTVTVYGLVHGFKHATSLPDGLQTTLDAGIFSRSAPAEGWSVNAGLSVPAGSGAVKLAAGWLDAESETDGVNDMQRLTFSAGYMLPLSKRTQLYAGAGWSGDDYGRKGVESADQWSVVSGMIHFF